MRVLLINLRTALFTAVVLTLISACVSTPPAPVRDLSEEASLAEKALAMGKYSEAAQYWQEAALVTEGPLRHSYRLQAAEAWMLAGENSRSLVVLDQVDEQQLFNDRLARYSLLHAELALASADAESADIYLSAARPNLANSQQERYRQLVARTARMRTDPASFALATAASALQPGSPYDSTKGVAILQLLEDVPSGTLQNISDETSGSFGLNGWPELSVMMRETLVGKRSVNEAAALWAREHPAHDVDESGFKELARRYTQLFSLPSSIAVLLPTDGGLAAAGAAIRDGMMSAFLAQSEGVTMKFYPTNNDPQSAVSAYFQAMGDGAEWIIGPLRRESVAALSSLGSLGVPALALNSAQAEPSGQSSEDLLFRLSLSQEQEARAIAERAITNNQSKAILLTVDTAWGRRMEAAFAEAFIEAGGSIITSTQFSSAESDHTSLLTGLLQIDQSNERKNRVQATLGTSLNFEPFRRDDFDLFFLAANPVQGRQLRPQLRFHDAGEIPVYAMSRIYSGKIDRSSDQDLNGIYFPSTHFQLALTPDEDLSRLASMRDGGFASLHALGRDAWNLLPWLPLMRKDPDLVFPGSVGSLKLDRNGQLLREPAWARFSRGRPVAVEWETSCCDPAVPQ